MTLPFFFIKTIIDKILVLDEDTSKYVINVLRMKKGEEVLLTDGKGKKAKAFITDDNRKKCTVEISSIDTIKKRENNVSIAISLIKNTFRFEWFLEKATEIGVNEIIPLICERTEKERFRLDRMQNILTSAMLQSQQCWLPVLQEPIPFNELLNEEREGKKFIAHCLPESKQQLSSLTHHSSLITHSIILIGPEGDFTEKEIQLALERNFIPVALGNTRLRTETAGIVAATLLANPANALNLIN
jgi:16S rRNA (uracil1498-N3)-methyltransferase